MLSPWLSSCPNLIILDYWVESWRLKLVVHELLICGIREILSHSWNKNFLNTPKKRNRHKFENRKHVWQIWSTLHFLYLSLPVQNKKFFCSNSKIRCLVESRSCANSSVGLYLDGWILRYLHWAVWPVVLHSQPLHNNIHVCVYIRVCAVIKLVVNDDRIINIFHLDFI